MIDVVRSVVVTVEWLATTEREWGVTEPLDQQRARLCALLCVQAAEITGLDAAMLETAVMGVLRAWKN